MKKIITIVCALLCVSLLLGACSKSEDGAPDGMKQASSDNVDYIMYVPENWKVDKSELYTSAFYSSADATSISAAANGVAADETVETWWDGFYEKFTSVYSDCGEPESTDVTLGGTDGEKYTFSGMLNGQEYKYIIAACVRGGYVYYLTYTSTPDYYENHLDEFDKTVENFSFR